MRRSIAACTVTAVALVFAVMTAGCTVASEPPVSSPAPPAGNSYEDAVRDGLVLEEYDVRVSVVSIRGSEAGGSLEVVFRIANAGDANDTYTLETEGSSGVEVSGGVPKTLALKAGDSIDVPITATAPPGVVDPTVTLRATSEGNPLIVDEAQARP